MYRITSLSVAAAGPFQRKKRRFARICGCESGGATRLCRGVLRSSHACQYVSIGVFCARLTPVNMFLLGRFAFGSRLSLFLCQEKRDGLRKVAFLFRRGSGSPLVRSRMSCGYRTLLVHFELLRFFVATPTGLRSRRRGGSAFLRKPLGFVMFPRGVRWGLRAPKPALKSQKWKPHCGLSGLSSFDSRQSSFGRKSISLAMLSAGSTLGLKCGSRTAVSLDSLLLIRGRVLLAKHRNTCYL